MWTSMRCHTHTHTVHVYLHMVADTKFSPLPHDLGKLGKDVSAGAPCLFLGKIWKRSFCCRTLYWTFPAGGNRKIVLAISRLVHAGNRKNCFTQFVRGDLDFVQNGLRANCGVANCTTITTSRIPLQGDHPTYLTSPRSSRGPMGVPEPGGDLLACSYCQLRICKVQLSKASPELRIPPVIYPP